MGDVYLMFGVAALCVVGGGVWLLRPAKSDASVYRHRIGGTMLIGAALVLAGFAAALLSWSREAAA